ncbi:ABC transporter permease [Brooklawnia cerclae]|uniref:Transport permease protein n=1 Tax=Brooklawnia cerclae TaxID=349934 RepID=A0ABX0SC86_9ACTN|nr:ABC transporter permease [Brooklawnia cerclae]NIH55544.1 ABC-2 type transport system permease protein [Brooklawnia cerclae]
MNPRTLFATVGRILGQMRHDPRTMAIVTVIPLVVVTLLHYLFDEREPVVSFIEAVMLVVFPIVVMFLLTAVATVRERTSGTLERLMTTPIRKADILFGYAIAFGLLATVLAAVAAVFVYQVLDMQVAGPVWAVLLTAVVSAQLGVAFGLLASAVSRSEFQAVQLFPVLAVPQLLLCGLFVSRDQMADWLRVLSDLMPMTYGVEAMTEVLGSAEPTTRYWRDLGIVAGCVVALLAIASATLRRRTP